MDGRGVCMLNLKELPELYDRFMNDPKRTVLRILCDSGYNVTVTKECAFGGKRSVWISVYDRGEIDATQKIIALLPEYKLTSRRVIGNSKLEDLIKITKAAQTL